MSCQTRYFSVALNRHILLPIFSNVCTFRGEIYRAASLRQHEQRWYKNSEAGSGVETNYKSNGGYTVVGMKEAKATDHDHQGLGIREERSLDGRKI